MLQQNNKLENMLKTLFSMNKPSSSGPLPSNTVANPKGDLKAITTRSGVSYDGPPIPPPFSSSPKVVEREPEVTKDPVQPSTEKVQPPDVPTQAPTSEPVNAPKPKPNLPYPSRLNNQKLRERDDHQMMKFLQIFQSLHFDLSFTDALLYMPKFASTFKNLLSNKEKLFELANTPVNENCSAVILKKLPEKLGDPDKFLIPCNFPEVDRLAWRSVSRKVPFSAKTLSRHDYVVNPRVPLILRRPFLRTARALIDVYGEELTLRVSDEAITFKVGNTSRYSYNDAESINRIDVIDIACEEYSQEVLGFSDNSESGNPTPISEPIIAKIAIPYSCTRVVREGDIRLIEEMLNNDPYSPLPPKDLKCEELKSVKSSVDEPPELELKDLPSHLEYAFLERKLNDATQKDHFPLPFIDQMLERLTGNEYYCFLDGFLGYFQIPIDPQNQEKTTFTCPYGTFAYRRMPFGLCNAPGTFQRCMMTIFYDMIEETMEVFMDDFSVFGDSFSSCLSHLDKMLKRCKDTNLVLNWEKFHFMVKEGIVLGHEILKSGIEVDRANVDVIAKLPPPTSVKGIRRPLGSQVLLAKQDASEIALLESSPLRILMSLSVNKRSRESRADHLSRLENPHQSDPEKKEITKTFPLETLGMKSSISSRIATMDPPGDIMVPTTPLKKSLIPVSIGRRFIEMPMTWSNGVTLVNVKANLTTWIKLPQNAITFARILAYGASDLYGAHSRL
ncbi:reverse transcriptase domain-containing protein [Tanacetum coccineum]